jgi:hypothetical protein
MNALLRWYHTIRWLKPAQMWHLVLRPIRTSLTRRHHATEADIAGALVHPAITLFPLRVPQSFSPGNQEFCFLNRSHSFGQVIDWDYREHGLLWTYNLNYFEWLYDDSITVEARLKTIQDFLSKSAPGAIAGDAYPISLRSISWIRFLLRFGVKDNAILLRLYRDVQWLYHFPEYHLQGNHLWENAMALFCAGLYFGNDNFHGKGRRLLDLCIKEQILADGGHVEGSPMYHSLLLWRLMQCLELLPALAKGKQVHDTACKLMEAASKMLGWLEKMTFNDGTWPMFSDCSTGIAPPTAELLRFAAHLGIQPAGIQLQESGYRMIRCGDFELAIDLSPVQPAYQPGHAHADTGNFCLYYRSEPIIVDTGCSTYESSERRLQERSTQAHNTVVAGGRNSSEVWKSFRVGRRVSIVRVEENAASISFSYVFYGSHLEHHRAFSWNDNCITISDKLEGKEFEEAAAFLHFHPEIRIERMDVNSFRAGPLYIQVAGLDSVRVDEYQYAEGFNKLRPAAVAIIGLKKELSILISSTIPAGKISDIKSIIGY